MPPLDLAGLHWLSRSLWAAAALHAAVQMGVFTLLKAGPLTATQVATRLQASPRYTESLLRVLVTQGLLEYRGETYANAPIAQEFLVRGQPRYQGDIMLHRADLWAAWGNLDRSILEGKPYPPPHQDATYWDHYIQGHDNIAKGGQADLLLQHVDLASARSLLDVGGGAGSYVIAACQQHPALRGTVLDLPEALAVAKRCIAQAGLQDRIALREGDYRTVDFGGPHDAVLFSGVVCAEDEETVHSLFRKAYAALAPGGIVIVQDALQMPSDAGSGRAQLMALFDLLLLLVYNAKGGARSGDTIALWLERVGFRAAKLIPFPSLFSLVVAKRPGD
jgi:predicted O-methyltransferase YrrM